MGGPVSGAGRVIVGTSGSPGSLCALRYAEGLARAHEAVLMPVIAWEPPGGDRTYRVAPSPELRQEWRRLAARRLHDALVRSEAHTSELQSPYEIVCRLLIEKKKKNQY